MNKIKLVSLTLSAVMFAACSALCACNDAPPEKELPEIKYGIEDEVPSVDSNDGVYSVAAVKPDENSPLKGKTFYWLGSSVTYGASSQGEAMSDFLAAMTGCTCVKEAVSGTTLYDDGGNGDSGAKSYTRRLINGTNFDKNAEIDAFICQISTNDARNDRLNKWGEITGSDITDINEFDRKTTLGGIEYIIAYVIETWHCPVYFYSGSYFGDEGNRKSTNPTGTNYGKLVDEVKKVVQKWQTLNFDVDMIDLYNDADFNSKVSDEYYAWCTKDAIHPQRAGYLQWWTPYFENFLTINVAMK